MISKKSSKEWGSLVAWRQSTRTLNTSVVSRASTAVEVEEEQSKSKSQTLTPSCAHAVEKGSMHVTSALLKMLPATVVSGKAIMVHSVTQNLLQPSLREVKVTLKVLSWILSPPIRKRHGFQMSKWAQRPSSSNWTLVQK